MSYKSKVTKQSGSLHIHGREGALKLLLLLAAAIQPSLSIVP